jgi:hypothetical protein
MASSMRAGRMRGVGRVRAHARTHACARARTEVGDAPHHARGGGARAGCARATGGGGGGGGLVTDLETALHGDIRGRGQSRTAVRDCGADVISVAFLQFLLLLFSSSN